MASKVLDQGNDILGNGRDPEDDVMAALELTQALQVQMDAARAQLSAKLLRVVRALVRPGSVLDKHGSDFDGVSVSHGNGRGARRFEIASEPRISKLDVSSPSLTVLAVEAYPLNEAGKRLSGRAGNSRFRCARDQNTVVLSMYLSRSQGPDDERSCNEMVRDLVRRAAAAAGEPVHARG